MFARVRLLSPRTSQWLERLLPFLIFVVSLLYLSLFRRFSVMDLDEGIILQAAERILHGQVPYRDFFMFYTPGSAYLVAALFKVFGDSFAVARSSIAVAGAVCTAITYVLSRRVCSRNIALLAAALSMLNSFAYRFLVLHNWYGTLFASLAIYAALRLWESQRSSWAFVCGSLAAITTLIEQSKGAGLCLGLVVGYLILRFSGRRPMPELQTRRHSGRRISLALVVDVCLFRDKARRGSDGTRLVVAAPSLRKSK